MTTMVTLLDVPRPLPSVPCPVFDGRPVQWQPWTAQPRVTHIDPSCNACAFPGPLAGSFGKVIPLPGEEFDSTRTVTLRSGHTYERPTKVPAWPVWRLSAELCPTCYDLILRIQGGHWTEIQTILCDGCDVLCAAGATLDEARHTLTTVYGGWTGGDSAVWDLCARCNPATTPDAPPRALAAVREARKRVGA